ncbi:MAG: TetR/AcrR family transcriptional regulator [Clostridiales bacterium]|nr:TetR/AcrR family transcriptional regulator [Clostridiales bacterium]
MKQEEKNRKSREHILSFAFAEFAEQGYMGASINTICSAGKISKGLLYHYYTDKDALYLACVQRCVTELTEYLSAHLDAGSITPDQYFDVRLAYFGANPLHQKLFCDTVVNPPQHLREEIAACRAEFDRLNETMLAAILEKETLAEGITIHDAIRQLRVFEDFVSTCLKNAGQEARQVEEHNKLCRQTFQTMLYGLIART